MPAPSPVAALDEARVGHVSRDGKTLDQHFNELYPPLSEAERTQQLAEMWERLNAAFDPIP